MGYQQLQSPSGETGDNYSQQAIDLFDQALQLEPNYVDAIVYKAITYIDLEQPAQALEQAETAISLSPLHENAWYYKAQAHASLGQTDAAITAYEKVLEINPNNEYAVQELIELDPSRDTN